MERPKTTEIIGMMILLFFFWLLISWKLDLINIGLGAAFSIFVAFFMAPELIRASERPPFLRRWHVFLKFVVVLVWEVIKANFQVVQIVLSRKMPIEPGFVEIEQPLRKPVTQVLWGNAITLTPGTLTVELDRDKLKVHYLQPIFGEHFQHSPVLRILKDLEAEK